MLKEFRFGLIRFGKCSSSLGFLSNVNKQLISRKKKIQNCLYKKKFFYAPCSHNYLDDVFEAAVGDCFQINTSLGKILNNVDVTVNKQLIIIISCVNKQLP